MTRKTFLSRQFVFFLATGGVAALVNFGSRIIYSRWMDFSPAVVLAYLTGMLTAFVLARAFVFTGSSRPVAHSAAFFALVNLAAVLQTWIVSLVLADSVFPALGIRHFAAEIAHAIGIAVPVFTSYLGHKRWSFR
ncbi:MAG: GtrA family protein [Lautropia sp.]